MIASASLLQMAQHQAFARKAAEGALMSTGEHPITNDDSTSTPKNVANVSNALFAMAVESKRFGSKNDGGAKRPTTFTFRRPVTQKE